MPRTSSLIQEQHEPAILKFFYSELAQNPKVFDHVQSWEQESQRYYWEGIDPCAFDGNKLVSAIEGIDQDVKKNQKKLIFLLEKANEFLEARPTLLRLGADLWCSQVQGRQENQRALRQAAIRAVTLRAAAEEKSNVLMSWDSLEKMIQLMTGNLPGREPLKRLFAWFASGDSPFTVSFKGKKNVLGKSTTLVVSLPELTDWRLSLDPGEQELTKAWLQGSDRVLGELAVDEARRRAERPATKGRLTRDAEIREQMAGFEAEASFLFSQIEPPNTGNVKTTSLWGLTVVDEKKEAMTEIQVPEPAPETEQERFARLFPSLTAAGPVLSLSDPVIEPVFNFERNERQERLARCAEESRMALPARARSLETLRL